ncbi:MAG: hypothetical protein D4Q77_01085 [Methanothrix sp.]|nr:MAG: hypothetical protein D4Q77_01085 [Methanothrix sp.]
MNTPPKYITETSLDLKPATEPCPIRIMEGRYKNVVVRIGRVYFLSDKPDENDVVKMSLDFKVLDTGGEASCEDIQNDPDFGEVMGDIVLNNLCSMLDAPDTDSKP